MALGELKLVQYTLSTFIADSEGDDLYYDDDDDEDSDDESTFTMNDGFGMTNTSSSSNPQHHADAAHLYLAQAKEKFLKAESLHRGVGSFHLACVASLAGDQKECERWLNQARGHGSFHRYEELFRNDLISSACKTTQ